MRRQILSLAQFLMLSLVAGGPTAGAAQPGVGGTVLAPDGGPRAGVRILLLPIPSADEAGRSILEGRPRVEPVAATLTDAAGRFFLQPPSSGPWRLVVEGSGVVPMHYFPLVLTAPTELHRLVLLRDHGASLRILNPNGEPLTDAWVWASRSADSPPLGLGGWRSDVRLGRVGAGGRVVLPRGENEQLDVSVVASLRMVASRTAMTAGDIRMPPPASAAWLELGTEGGKAAVGILARVPGHVAPLGVSGSEGRLRLLTDIQQLELSTADGWRHTAAISPSIADPLRLRLERLAPKVLAGRVQDLISRRPLTDALVWSGADPGVWARTDAQGRYRLPVPATPGLWLQAEAVGHVPQSIAIGAGHLAGERAPTVGLMANSELHAQVSDSKGKALAGVLVEAVALRGGKARKFFRPDPLDGRGLSDEQGRIVLGGLEGDLPYELRLSLAGYVTATVAVDSPGILERRPPPRWTLVSARGAFGRVLDVFEQPLAGVEVILRGTGQTPPKPSPGPLAESDEARRQDATRGRGWSDATGRFEIAEIPADQIQLSAFGQGYAPVTVRGIEIPKSAPPGPVDLGVVILVAGQVLEGQIVGPDGEGIAEAAIHRLTRVDPNRLESLTGQRLVQLPPATSSGSEGHFRLTDLVAGEPVNLFVQRAGYVPVWVKRVEVPARLPLTIVLRSGLGFSGQIVDPEGKPVEGVDLLLEQEGPSTEKRMARSDLEGRFAFEGLPKTKATLSIFHAAYVAPPAIELTTAQLAEGLRLVLERGAVLVGRVATASDEPIAQARVTAGSAASFSDAEGIYRLEGVAPGPTTVEASHQHFGRSMEEAEIEIGINTQDFAFPDGVTVSGVVVDADRRGVFGAAVQLSFEAGHGVRYYNARSTEEGTFRLQAVAEGHYRLEVRLAGFATTETRLTVAGEALEELELVLERGTLVGGEVLGLEFDQLARTRVWAEGDGGRRIPGQIDYQGRYEILDLPAGGWLLRASLDEGRRQAQTRLNLTPGVGQVDQDLHFEERLTLSGLVLQDGEPLPDTQVSLEGGRLAVHRSGVTDHRGSFRIEDLAADTYNLGLANAPNRLVYNRKVELDSDRDLVLDLRQARIRGRVVEEVSGLPVDRALVVLRRFGEDGGVTNVLSAGSDPEGRFEFARVPEGSYRALVHKDGYAAEPRHLEIANGDQIRDLELRIEGTGGLEVAVRLTSGEIPRQITVLVFDSQGQAQLQESRAVGADGRVHLPTIPIGAWRLMVGAPGAVPAMVAAEVPGPPVEVELALAGAFEILVPALHTSNEVASLRLMGPDNRPLQSIDQAAGLIERWPLVGGRARVDGIPAGLWQVQVTSPDGQSWLGAAVSVPRQSIVVSLP